MSNKPVGVPNIGFNEALQRIAKFDKEKLPDNLRQNSKEKTSLSKDDLVKEKTRI